MKLKITILAVLTFICGCVTPQKISSPKVEIEKAPKEILQQLAPLFPDGTKPLLIYQESLRQDPISNISACVDPKTGKEKRFTLADLKSEQVPLSYSTVERVVASLQVMGVETIVAATATAAPYTVDSRGRITYLPKPEGIIAELKKDYSCSDLPVFYKLIATEDSTLTTMLDGPGSRGQQRNDSKFSFIDMKSADYGVNETLVAFYHPEQMKRFENIKSTITKTFDSPPLQVFIESMVLEVNEDGLEQLGVLYKNTLPRSTTNVLTSTAVGALTPQSTSSAADTPVNLFSIVAQRGAGVGTIADILSVEINALVTKGYAEVLSRPSVIALNDRAAVIEVTEQKQFPLRTTTPANSFAAAQTGFTFEAVSPGILLQIRPKVADEANEVAMQIDVQVKALVSGNDGEAFNDGTADDNTPKLVATKPGSSTRRVHTFAIVPNKTPIIIGGLVSKDIINTENKIPFFGDLPYIGRFFGATSEKVVKKELIIVITPHIIRNTLKPGIQTPKDTDMFDDTDMNLFRDSYRVRSEDMFDLGFVYRSKKFKQYRNYVVKRIKRDKAFAKTRLAHDYTGEQFPGGDALVSRMIYDIVGKRKLENNVSGDRIILTERTGKGKFKEVTFLKKAWRKAKLMSETVSSVGQGQQDYGLELKFSTKKTNSSVQPHIALRILPKAEIALLSETSKHDSNPTRIFIDSEKDLKKIRKAIVVREIIKINKSELATGSLNSFHTGRKLVLPVIEKTRHFLLDLDVARAYHHAKYYYPILEKSLHESFRSIEKVIENDNEKL